MLSKKNSFNPILVIVVVGSLSASGVWVGVQIKDLIDPPPQPQRIIVFVHGINSDADCEPKSKDGFRALWDYISSEGVLGLDDNQTPYVFSYAKSDAEDDSGKDCDGAANYNKIDTCSSIYGDGGHSDRFGAWFDEIRANNDRAEFDIIAHSMGGVVVLHWLSRLGEQPSQVRSIITLDSPLQGRSLDLWEKIVAQFAAPCRGMPAIEDLKPDSATIMALNEPLAPGSYPDECIPGEVTDISRLARILTVRNNADLVVLKAVACMPGADDFPADCRDGLTIKFWVWIASHSCVFTDPDVQARIKTELLTEQP